jgi:hypothetical protein
VFGESTVPNASGVFGAHNNAGTGVFGFADKGDGVRGVTHTSAKGGMIGINDDKAAAPAGTPSGNGVFGVSTVPNASGVFGAHNNAGTGVFGFADKGTGVFGRGGKFAAFFDGTVLVIGELSVNGTGFSDLLRRVAALESKIVAPPPPPSATQSISVSAQGQGNYTVTGTGFGANKTVTIRVADSQGQYVAVQHSADASGHLSAVVPVQCVPGTQLNFSATDSRSDPDPHNVTGVVWSNTFKIGCS